MLQFFRLQKLNRNESRTDIRRCSLVLSASSAASASTVAAAAATALHYCWLVLLGVFFSLPTLLRKLCTSIMVVNSQKSSGYEY